MQIQWKWSGTKKTQHRNWKIERKFDSIQFNYLQSFFHAFSAKLLPLYVLTSFLFWSRSSEKNDILSSTWWWCWMTKSLIEFQFFSSQVHSRTQTDAMWCVAVEICFLFNQLSEWSGMSREWELECVLCAYYWFEINSILKNKISRNEATVVWCSFLCRATLNKISSSFRHLSSTTWVAISITPNCIPFFIT